MATEQVLYAQVIMLYRKDLELIATDEIKNEAKLKFQGQSARSQRWFDLDFDWIEVNFSTRELCLYNKLFQSHVDTQYTNTFCISYWNLKAFKCICILCIVIALKKFLIEIRLKCAKIYLNQIKVNIKPTL